MGTRSGSLDPRLLLFLLRSQGLTPGQLDDLLNRQSDLLGVSGRSADVRVLEQAAGDGDARAELALTLFAYQVRKYIGAYAAALEGVDAVGFTGGIGENSPRMRARICQGLGFLGICLDAGRNQPVGGDLPVLLSQDGKAVAVWMVPTDEERQIALETWDCLR